MHFIKIIIYSEKQLKDIIILLTLKHLRKVFPDKLIFYLIDLQVPLCNSEY